MYLDLKEDSIKLLRDEAIATSEKNLGSERDDELTFDNLEMSNPECEFDNGTINYSGSIVGYDKGKVIDFGYVSVDIKLDLELVIDIIELYMKKLGKLKTVLEATK